jgi:hypothetical protein
MKIKGALLLGTVQASTEEGCAGKPCKNYASWDRDIIFLGTQKICRNK